MNVRGIACHVNRWIDFVAPPDGGVDAKAKRGQTANETT
jgi:hypothetical protein